MEKMAVDDMKNVLEDPAEGCIVQGDDPQSLALVFEGANESSTKTGNTSWYWRSMLKLMEQGAAQSMNSSSTHTTTNNNNNNNNANSGSHFTPKPHACHTPMPAPATSSPSSSSVHDQPLDMLLNNNAMISNNGADSLMWSEDFLRGPICESKSSTAHHFACSADDGLHELLYPRTVLELLLSDQVNNLEQLPSWSDVLQQTVGVTSIGFPLALDKIVTAPPTTPHIMMNSENQPDINIPPYLNSYSHFTALEDRLSSSTASSTLSDNTIDQWMPLNVAGQCENAQAPCLSIMHMPSLSSMQQTDHINVKQEYTDAPSPPYNDINANQYREWNRPYLHQSQRLMGNCAGNVMDEAIFNEYEQKPALIINKNWNPPIMPNDPLNHRQHIYESITAANFSRLGALDPANCFQHVNNQTGGTGVITIDHSQIGRPGGAPVSLYYINQALQELGKKSRLLEAAGTAGQVDETRTKKNERAGAAAAAADIDIDTKAKGAVHVLPAPTSASSPTHPRSATDYNFKRSRIDQNPPPPPPTSSSSSSFKSQPVRKEKLGERITTLQQLVSPFGKTDTASVLLEAIGYIKFLQEQVQAILSTPYFETPSHESGDGAKSDLKSRGLCLVPLSCTLQIENGNGANYWYGGTFS